jgi:hypothetical protein
MPLPHRADSSSQQIDMLDEQIVAAPLQQVDGEEIRSTAMPGAAIIGHSDSIPVVCIRRNALRLLRPTLTATRRGQSPQVSIRVANRVAIR